MQFYKIWKEEESHTPEKDFQALEERVAKAGQRRSHVCWVETGLRVNRLLSSTLQRRQTSAGGSIAVEPLPGHC